MTTLDDAAERWARFIEGHKFPALARDFALRAMWTEATEAAAKKCDLLAHAERSADDSMAGTRNAKPYERCAAAIRGR